MPSSGAGVVTTVFCPMSASDEESIKIGHSAIR